MIRITQRLLNETYKYSSAVSQLKRQKQCQIAKKLKSALSPTFLSVNDTTLGANSCGQMYKITIESPLFYSITKVQQHRMVANAIGQEMKSIHGYSLKTRTPSTEEDIQSHLQSLQVDQQ